MRYASTDRWIDLKHDLDHVDGRVDHHTLLASFLYCEKGERIYVSRNGCVRNGGIGGWILWCVDVGFAELTLIAQRAILYLNIEKNFSITLGP